MTPLDEILRFDPNEPRLSRDQERQQAFFRARQNIFALGRDGVETFTAESDQPISDAELYRPENNTTLLDLQRSADRAVMLWACVIRDAREGS
jgi:hypothetical protein